MRLSAHLNQWISNPALKVPDSSELQKTKAIHPLNPDSAEAKKLQQAAMDSYLNKKDLANALGATAYTIGKLSTKLPDRKVRLAGALGIMIGKGLGKGFK